MPIRSTLVAVVAGLVVSSVPATAGQELPRLPKAWPERHLEIGLASQPGEAQWDAISTDAGFRYQYLTGGVNTGDGWQTWQETEAKPGIFVSRYINESYNHGLRPVFSYYMLQKSDPGGGDEDDVILTNLNTTDTMRDYYDYIKVFFKRAGEFPNRPVVLQIEPDLWGYVEQHAPHNDAAKIPAKVAATGLGALAGLPNNVSGFARALVRLRNQIAPNVIIGYHISVWGTNVDIAIQDPSNDRVDRLARKAADFYESLNAGFDVSFAEFTDRDAAFKEAYDNPNLDWWWHPSDFNKNVRFLGGFVRRTGRRVVMWQIPLGNTIMKAMNNTDWHYQDNKVELLFGGDRALLRKYVDAGVIAFLFGAGAEGATHATDAGNDDVTNPNPINGNTKSSYNADDDGGYFRHRAKAYYNKGAIRLP